jgi:23S rRNA (adenine2503-C2)-methyltransferase
MAQMAAFGERYFAPGDLKISLNFAAVKGAPLNPERVADVFSPEKFVVKLTPVNPTRSSIDAGIGGIIDPVKPDDCVRLVEQFQKFGFETILSIGDLAENQIGSNCGMYVSGCSEHSSRNEKISPSTDEAFLKNGLMVT